MKRPKNPIIEFSDGKRFELAGGSFDEFNKYIDHLEHQNKELIESRYKYITEIDELLNEGTTLEDWDSIMSARKYIRKLIRNCDI